MSIDGDYDPGNIFARIIRKESSAAIIFEDAETLAFMDAFPQARGHCLVVHNQAEARNLLDISPAGLCAVMHTVQRVARAVKDALAPDGVIVTQFNGAAAGQTVYHLHVHIIPRWKGTTLGRHAGEMADPGELALLANQVAAAIKLA